MRISTSIHCSVHCSDSEPAFASQLPSGTIVLTIGTGIGAFTLFADRDTMIAVRDALAKLLAMSELPDAVEQAFRSPMTEAEMIEETALRC